MHPLVATGFSFFWPVFRRSVPLLGIALLSSLTIRAPARAHEIIEVTLVDSSSSVNETSWIGRILLDEVDRDTAIRRLLSRQPLIRSYLEARGVPSASIVFSRIDILGSRYEMRVTIMNTPTAAVAELARDTTDFSYRAGLCETGYLMLSSGPLF